jgi:hypothetical protein
MEVRYVIPAALHQERERAAIVTDREFGQVDGGRSNPSGKGDDIDTAKARNKRTRARAWIRGHQNPCGKQPAGHSQKHGPAIKRTRPNPPEHRYPGDGDRSVEQDAAAQTLRDRHKRNEQHHRPEAERAPQQPPGAKCPNQATHQHGDGDGP